jgi:hypothetical protein
MGIRRGCWLLLAGCLSVEVGVARSTFDVRRLGGTGCAFWRQCAIGTARPSLGSSGGAGSGEIELKRSCAWARTTPYEKGELSGGFQKKA